MPRAYEVLAIAYYAAFALAATRSRASRGRITVVAITAAALAAAIAGVASMARPTTRDWLPHAYLLAGYWLPALLVDATQVGRFEAWLVRSDATWRQQRRGLPRRAAAMLEACYLACYPALPIAFSLVWIAGDLADIDRFWCAVLGAGFICYAGLPWLVGRPPWVIDAAATEARDNTIARLNRSVLRRVSHQRVTFPSGHVAVSAAAALSVAPVAPAAAAVMTALAVGIAGGAISGNYHYRVDVASGGLVGVTSALLAQYIVT